MAQLAQLNCKVNPSWRAYAFPNYFITIPILLTVGKNQKIQIQLQADSFNASPKRKLHSLP